MKRTASVIVLACLFWGTSCARFERISPAPVPAEVLEDETLNAILRLVFSRSLEEALRLRESKENDGYVVVDPETTLGLLDEPGDLEHVKEQLELMLEGEGCDVGALVDRFVEQNRKPYRLLIESSPEDGYVIDYDGEYTRYFGKGLDAWDKFYKNNPGARGCTHVSVPAYDPKSQVVLVYVGTQTQWLAGVGYIAAFRYEDGQLRPLACPRFWVS